MGDSEWPISERDFAATYDGGSYMDAWEAVEQYRKATSYAFRNDVKSGATASALDLPRSRLRTWIDDGGAPDVVRGLESAHEHGWLECAYDDATFQGLNALVANVFSGGSIAEETYMPSFALNHRGDDSHVFDALELAGVEYDVIERGPDRADEVRPTADGSVLGRVLSTLGAPVGPKTDQHLTLPPYLEDAPDDVKATFVYAYLENRAIEHEGRATLHIEEKRNRSYLADLAEVINEVAGGGVDLRERVIVISADAARELGTVR